MLKYILKRLGLAVLILLGVSLILYILIRCMPSNFVENIVLQMSAGGATIPQETIDALYKMYGLADGSFWGIIKGYFSWLWSLMRFDLGTSFKFGVPVIQDIADHMSVSFIVSFLAIILDYRSASPLGVTAAPHQYSLRD